MYFTDASFLAFFAVVWAGWSFAGKWRAQWLAAASVFFLAAFSPMSAVFCVAMALLNFSIARFVQHNSLYVAAQFINAAAIPLAAWTAGNAFSFEPESGVHVAWIAVGLSFYNLQHIAYLADVRKQRISMERDALVYFLGAAYFPKLLSGPITLHQQIGPQISALPSAKSRVATGFNRILLGYFKKLVLAEGLAPSVGSVFDYHDALPGITVFAAAVLFTLQLYFDFSGYCDIAIGCSRLLGIDLPENFHFPLRARSMSDFWRRWHMTLLGFFATYVFLPAAFRLRNWKRHAAAAGIVMVFLLSAVWHGFGITFLVWGISHAAYMLVEYYFRAWTQKIPCAAGTVLVWLLFSFSNVFFRAPGWEACRSKLTLLFGQRFVPAAWDVEFLAPLAVGGHQQDLFNFFVVLLMGGLFLLFERKIFQITEEQKFRVWYAYVTTLLIVLFGVFGDAGRFIYMQF